MTEAAVRLHDAIRGLPFVLLVVVAGLYLTFLLKGLQFRGLPRGFRLGALVRDDPNGDGDISHFQALMAMVGSGVGTGSLAGVALALGTGGPGALVWLWVAGLLAMAIRFGEAVLGVRYRETDVAGLKSGGPMHYLEGGLRWGRGGRVLGLGFAGLTVIAALGFGNAAQAHTLAVVASGVSGVPPLAVGAVTAVAVGVVVLGGIRSIGRTAGLVVPVALVAYLGVAAWVVWVHRAALPEVLGSIFGGALGGEAAGGGVAGFALARVLHGGLLGASIGEAGIGTGAIVAAAARTREPVDQALVAMCGTFIDTLLIGTATGLALLCAGRGALGPADGVPGTFERAFAAGLPLGSGAFVSGVVVAFAFAAMIAWAYYGERCARYLAGERAVLPFRLLFIGLVPLSAVMEMRPVWAIAGSIRWLMVVPTLIGLVLLSGLVAREARGWYARRPAADSGAAQPSNGG